MEMEKTESSGAELVKKQKVCCFCNTDEVNELRLGPIKWRNDIAVHYYCLLLASDFVEQHGRDNEGIAGFLLPDIRKEIKKCRSNVCVYCRKTGASIFCHQSNCRVVFHLPCGLRCGTLSRFDKFHSYCHKHRPYQNIAQFLKEPQLKVPWSCVICFEPVSPTDLQNTLWGPCCKKAAGYHRDCIQTLALSSGYLFRCPLCNDKYNFRLEMMSQGIYIPMQDASWEMEDNAYQDQHVRYCKCDALECICRYGREFKRRGTRWDMVLCKYCGSQGVHLACGFLSDRTASWECNICRTVTKMTRQTQVQPLYKYGSRYISKSEDVAMVQLMSASWREEIYSRARTPSMRLARQTSLRNLSGSYRFSVHPELLRQTAPLFRSPSGSRNHMDKTICSNFDDYLVVDADRAPQKSNPVNYLNIIRKRHLIDDSSNKDQKRVRSDTIKDEIHLKYRKRYTVKHVHKRM